MVGTMFGFYLTGHGDEYVISCLDETERLNNVTSRSVCFWNYCRDRSFDPFSAAIDDRLPFHPTEGTLMCMSILPSPKDNTEEILWPSILEKAVSNLPISS